MKRYKIKIYTLEDFMNDRVSFDDMFSDSIYDYNGYSRHIKRLRYGIDLFINKWKK
jgi:hypothetical protein